jgi:hypothetical protein
MRVKPKRQAGQIYERTFGKWGAAGFGWPTVTDLRNNASALASPSLIARNRNERRE